MSLCLTSRLYDFDTLLLHCRGPTVSYNYSNLILNGNLTYLIFCSQSIIEDTVEIDFEIATDYKSKGGWITLSIMVIESISLLEILCLG